MRRFPWHWILFALPIWSLVVVSCTHDQAWRASGETIDAMGKTFLATGHTLDALYDARRIDESRYERWREFCRYFKPAFDAAADRWLHGDDSASQHAAAVLAALAAELAEYEAMSRGAP